MGIYTCMDRSQMEKYPLELEIALSAVKKALRVCRRVQDRFVGVRGYSFEKEDRSPVTIADFASQAVITAELLKAFPADAIVGEEDAGLIRKDHRICDDVVSIVGEEWEGFKDNELSDLIDHGKRPFDPLHRFWTLDPIDGTKGYLAGRQYAVALALMEEGNVKLGVLACPGLEKTPLEAGEGGCILFGTRREGTRVMNIDGGDTEPITRKSFVALEQARLCESVEPSHSAHEIHARILQDLGISVPPLRMDSQAKYGAVALGTADIYLRIPRKKDYREKIWDHAAGTLIIEEAGGEVSDMLGRPLDFSKGEILGSNTGVVATAGGIHAQIISAVKRAIRPF